MKQNTLNPDYQRVVIDQAKLLYPDVKHIEVPLLIALPAGIHPYNRSSAYFDNMANAIVLYQDLGKLVINSGEIPNRMINTVRHELAHWYQFRFLGENGTGKTNVHRKASWMQACYVATESLAPGLMTRVQFNPTKSKRVEGKVVKVQRAGALTDVELHRWPNSIPALRV